MYQHGIYLREFESPYLRTAPQAEREVVKILRANGKRVGGFVGQGFRLTYVSFGATWDVSED